jgi:hypothetical protein
MADTPVTAPPFIPVKPVISIGTVGSAVDIACAAEELAVEVDQDDNTYETFCGSYTSYKPEKWTITATVFPSYGAAGLWNLLRPLVGTAQPFRVLPDAGASVGPANPQMTGTCIVKAFPFYTGKPGEPTSFDVEMAVQGVPTFPVTLAAADKAAKESAA